jgi:hypothetical protein
MESSERQLTELVEKMVRVACASRSPGAGPWKSRSIRSLAAQVFNYGRDHGFRERGVHDAAETHAHLQRYREDPTPKTLRDLTLHLMRLDNMSLSQAATNAGIEERSEWQELSATVSADMRRYLVERYPLDFKEVVAEFRRVTEGPPYRLTRAWQTEVRHVLLYVSQQASGMRTEVLRPQVNAGHVVVELESMMRDLQELRAYLMGEGSAPVHPNELAGAGAPPAGVIAAEQAARRAER